MNAHASRGRGRMKHIRGIDGLRAIAILCVMTAHLFLNYFAYAFGVVPNSLGEIGVSIFFVISGFLITGILLNDRDGDLPKGLALTRFYLRRALRIFPAYYALVLVGIFMQWKWFASLADWHLSYTTNFFIAHANHWIGSAGHVWSLDVEEQFYLLWPTVLLLVPESRLLSVITGFIAIGIISTATLESFGASELQTYVLPFCHFHELGLGALIAYVYVKNPDAIKRIEPSRPTTLLIGAATLIIYYGINYHHFNMLGNFADVCLVDVLTAAAIIRCINSPQSKIVSLLEFWPIRKIGRLSYGIYLIHNTIPLIFQSTRFSNAAQHSVIGFCIWIATTLGVAVLSWNLIEKPFLRLKTKVDIFITEIAHRQTMEIESPKTS